MPSVHNFLLHEEVQHVELQTLQVGALWALHRLMLQHQPFHRNGSNTPANTRQQSILLLTHLTQGALNLQSATRLSSSNQTPGTAFRTLLLEREPKVWFARNQYGTVCRYRLPVRFWGSSTSTPTLDHPNVGRLLPRGPGIYCNTWVT